MNRRNSVSIMDRIFKAVFNTRIERIHISTYEDKIRKLEKSEAELKRIVAHDSLTGALSVVEFNERVKYFLSLFKRFSFKNGDKRCFSVVFIDINKFKDINDTYGHEAGDNILINFTTFLKEQLRESDIVARKSGDEFLIFLEGSNFESSWEIMSNIKSRLKHNQLSTGDEDIEIEISFGVASTSEEISDIKKLITTADRRMYKQKNKDDK